MGTSLLCYRREDRMVTLVTGATGFIGRHLVERLVKEDREVRCLVRKYTGSIAGVEKVIGDINDVDSLRGIIRDVDIIYHLAARIETGDNQDFSKLYHSNVNGTANLLSVIPDNLKAFIFLGSMASIGIRDKKELVNEKTVCNPITRYGDTKLEAENILRNYAVILRLPTVYGPGEQHNFILMAKAIKGKQFMLIGSGNNLTSVCYIDNLIDAMLLAETKGKKGEIYHIADSNPVSWKDLATIIANELHVSLIPIHLPTSLAKGLSHFPNSLLYPSRVNTLTANFAYDISKAQRDLGYKPKIETVDGVKETIKWYKKEGLL
jgi:nucleoside-diphosphate-sugar epimerase